MTSPHAGPGTGTPAARPGPIAPRYASGARNLDLTKQKETTAPSDPKNQTPAHRALGDFAPKLVALTDNVLFGDVWQRGELNPRDRTGPGNTTFERCCILSSRSCGSRSLSFRCMEQSNTAHIVRVLMPGDTISLCLTGFLCLCCTNDVELEG
jgi:hypothetical protein